MASAWGNAWGGAWGDSWGRLVAPAFSTVFAQSYKTSYAQVYDALPRRVDAVMRRRTEGMDAIAWAVCTDVKMELPITLSRLSQTDLDELLTFESDNNELPFDFTWAQDGRTYSVQFLAPIQIMPRHYGYDAKMILGEI
jgi:hypothetical protein